MSVDNNRKVKSQKYSEKLSLFSPETGIHVVNNPQHTEHHQERDQLHDSPLHLSGL